MPPLLVIDSLAPFFGDAAAAGSSSSHPPPWSQLSLSLSAGDVLLVRGASGAGKTTLLRTLANLVPASEGGVLYRGSPPSQSPALYRSHVTYVAQRPPLLPGSPLDLWRTILDFEANKPIRRGRAAPDALRGGPSTSYSDVDGDAEGLVSQDSHGPGWRIEELSPAGSSTRIAAAHDSLRMPLEPERTAGLLSLPAQLMARDWNTLSGGEAQRAALAIALTAKARWDGQGVLLLDEPTSALDDQTAQVVERLLLSSEPPLTLVIITHSDAQAGRIVDLAAKTKRRVARLTLSGVD